MRISRYKAFLLRKGIEKAHADIVLLNFINSPEMTRYRDFLNAAFNDYVVPPKNKIAAMAYHSVINREIERVNTITDKIKEVAKEL